MEIDISNRSQRPVRQVKLPTKRVGGLSSDLLKLIAVIAMVIDHIAWAFVPFGSFAGQAMHVIGRLTAPIMCFLVAEGYHKTRDPKKYARRLGIFAAISHVPYVLFEAGEFRFIHQTSVMLPLFLGVVALIINHSPKYEQTVKSMITIIICLVSMLGDWGCIVVLWIMLFSANRFNRHEQIKNFCIIGAVMIIINIIMNASVGNWYINLFQLGIFLAVPLISRYNGVRRGGKGYKWFFYVFYPAHLVLLAVLKICVF